MDRSFLRHFTGLNACSSDLVPRKTLRSYRFGQHLKLSGGYETKLLRAELKRSHGGRRCAACCEGEHDQSPHHASFRCVDIPCTEPSASEMVERGVARCEQHRQAAGHARQAPTPVFMQARI
jgi:hypothetical protein